jgi:hypothetical protein
MKGATGLFGIMITWCHSNRIVQYAQDQLNELVLFSSPLYKIIRHFTRRICWFLLLYLRLFFQASFSTPHLDKEAMGNQSLVLKARRSAAYVTVFSLSNESNTLPVQLAVFY